MSKRQLSENEKQQVIIKQRELDGSLRCFISGEVINLAADEYEFDHIEPYAVGGDTSLTNIKVVLKNYNRRKSDQSLYEIRDNLRLERLFIEKRNAIKLQDVQILKSIQLRAIHIVHQNGEILISDGSENHHFQVFTDPIMNVDYFYGRLPVRWLMNDDQEGLQPRVIDYKRLIGLRDHLKNHPQMSPAIARLLGGGIRLFDGQHKIAAQILNGAPDVDVKVYISPDDPIEARKLFDTLMITNLEAHSKLRQVPFYTSTLIERLSIIYRELWEDFATKKPATQHSEANFIQFLVTDKGYFRGKANELFRSSVIDNTLSQSPIAQFVAEASKDASFPITHEIISRNLLPMCVYLQPSTALFDTATDFRNNEVENFQMLASALVDEGHLKDWVQRQGNTSLTNIQLKARRIWHKGAVLTWTPYLKDIIINTFNMMTEDERIHLLYRQKMNQSDEDRFRVCLHRLFSHPMWDSPEGEIDSLLVSAQKLRAPVKSHTLTGSCRTVGTRKILVKNIIHRCAAWTGFRVIFFENHRLKKDDMHYEWFCPEWHPPKWGQENGDASRSPELEKQSAWPFC